MKIFLTPIQQTELKTLHRLCKERRFADRLKAILLLDKGFSCAEVGEILLIDDDTVRTHRKNYLENGVSNLLSDNNNGGVPRLSAEQFVLLDEHLTQNTYADSSGIIVWIFKQFQVLYSPSGVVELIKKMGFVYKKPVLTPCKSDISKQEAFVEEYQIMKANLGENDTINFMDGVHPQHNTLAHCGWIKKGETKCLKTNNGRQRMNLNGVINLENKEVLIVESERINSQAVIITLEKMLEKQPQGIIHIVLDNAKYYHAKIVEEFLAKNPRIVFKFLPPYSPNLNSIERLWLILKKNVVYNQFYLRFSDFKEQINLFFENQVWKQPKYDRFLTDNFHLINPNFSGSFLG